MRSLDRMEPTLKYHPGVFEVLTLARDPGWGQCMVGNYRDWGGLLPKRNGGVRRYASYGRTS